MKWIVDVQDFGWEKIIWGEIELLTLKLEDLCA